MAHNLCISNNVFERYNASVHIIKKQMDKFGLCSSKHVPDLVKIRENMCQKRQKMFFFRTMKIAENVW